MAYGNVGDRTSRGTVVSKIPVAYISGYGPYKVIFSMQQDMDDIWTVYSLGPYWW